MAELVTPDGKEIPTTPMNKIELTHPSHAKNSPITMELPANLDYIVRGVLYKMQSIDDCDDGQIIPDDKLKLWNIKIIGIVAENKEGTIFEGNGLEFKEKVVTAVRPPSIILEELKSLCRQLQYISSVQCMCMHIAFKPTLDDPATVTGFGTVSSVLIPSADDKEVFAAKSKEQVNSFINSLYGLVTPEVKKI